jgi:hypothetical protein
MLAKFRFTLAPDRGMNLERLVIKPMPLCSRPAIEGAAEVVVLLPTSRLPTVLTALRRLFTAPASDAVAESAKRLLEPAAVDVDAEEMVWNALSRPKMPLLLVDALLPMLTREPTCLRAVRNCGWKQDKNAVCSF